MAKQLTQVGSQVWNQISIQARLQIEKQVVDWNPAIDQVWRQTRYQLWDQVCSQIRDQIRREVEP